MSADAGSLVVTIHLERGGREIEREAVLAADLAEARSEAWLQGRLRRGRFTPPLEDLATRVEPIRAGKREYCLGYAIEVLAPDAEPTRHTFSILSLQHVAARAARRLVAKGILRPEDVYYYELVDCPRGPRVNEPPPADSLFAVTATMEPLRFLEVPLDELLTRATPTGPPAKASEFPVFYTRAALEQAERFARRGARWERPVETGAVLVGTLCSCPHSGELSIVVCEVLEARDADRKTFSLTYSGKTWQRIQTAVRAMQQDPERQTFRIVGQCHGHNFPPETGSVPCNECPHVADCNLTSVFVSTDDLLWSRAVFSGQPWNLCHIFGQDARGEPVQSLYGVRDGRLRDRGFHVLPDFAPQAFASVTAEPARGAREKR